MNFKKGLSRAMSSGFTLIELLVVVAIIGILASVVLASLNTARAKGSDAAIKANLDNMRAQAALYYDGTSMYNTTSGTAITCTVTAANPNVLSGCTALFGDTTMLNGLKAAANASGQTVTATTDTTGALYAVEAVLKADTTGKTAWCIDSAGKSVPETLATANTAVAISACP